MAKKSSRAAVSSSPEGVLDNDFPIEEISQEEFDVESSIEEEVVEEEEVKGEPPSKPKKSTKPKSPTKKTNRFKLLAGNHREGGVNYRQGDVVKSELDLETICGKDKFEKIS